MQDSTVDQTGVPQPVPQPATQPATQPVPQPALSPTARYRSSLRELQRAQKPPRGVSLYSTRVNRPLGRRLAALADVAGLTPDQVTLLSAVCSLGAVAVLLLLPPSFPLGLAVSLLLLAGFALDSADGQLARLRRSGSAAGEFLDHMLDCLTKTALHAAVLVALHQAGQRGAVLLVPLGFLIAAVVLFFGGILAAKLHQSSGVPAEERKSKRVGGLASSLLLLPVDHGAVGLVFLLWGWLDWFQVAYGLLFLAHAVFAAGFSVLWYRELS